MDIAERIDQLSTAHTLVRGVVEHYLGNWDEASCLEPSTSPEILADALEVIYGRATLSQLVEAQSILTYDMSTAEAVHQATREAIAYALGHTKSIVMGANVDVLKLGNLLMLILWGEPMKKFTLHVSTQTSAAPQ
jgi:hypothetical protein